MTIYAQFDPSGRFFAAYPEEVYGPKKIVRQDLVETDIAGNPVYAETLVDNPDCRIPADAIPISEEDWHVFVSEPGQWIWKDGGRQSCAVPKTAEEVRRECKVAVAALRRQKETRGIQVGGMLIATDRESQSMLNAAVTALRNGYVTEVDWKGENGWVRVGLSELEPVAMAVVAHVQACFSAGRAHDDALDALDRVEDLSEYDITVGWP